MLARLTFPLSVAFAAAFTAQVEGMLVTRWAADRGSACSATSPTGACTLNGTISFLAGTFFAVETLAATLTALVDRKSTRLNSSHSQISYAVFCLKKKTRISYALLLGFSPYPFVVIAGTGARPNNDADTIPAPLTSCAVLYRSLACIHGLGSDALC